jgi:hypothetical protein
MIEFDEVLLDPYYSSLAQGGPEFLTLNTSSLAGVEQTAVRRYHYVSRYKIDYAEVEEERRRALREFHILSFGMAYAYRFLAPDDSTLAGELVTDGAYNPAAVSADIADYYLIKTHRRLGRTYQRRIVKPAWDTIQLQVGDETFAVEESAQSEFGTPLYGGVLYGGGPEVGITLDYTTGIITLDAGARAAFAGRLMRVAAGSFHLPVTFGDDWNQMATDPTAISQWTGLTIKEMLPASLGILI